MEEMGHFLGGRGGRRNKTEVEGLGKLLKFEGRQFRSINVKHPGLLSDTIKRLSPHPVCLHLTQSDSFPPQS